MQAFIVTIGLSKVMQTIEKASEKDSLLSRSFPESFPYAGALRCTAVP